MREKADQAAAIRTKSPPWAGQTNVENASRRALGVKLERLLVRGNRDLPMKLGHNRGT